MAFLLILDNTSQHFDSNDGSHMNRRGLAWKPHRFYRFRLLASLYARLNRNADRRKCCPYALYG